MVQSWVASVDIWLSEADPKRKSVLEAVRASALRNLPNHVESMRYGMPTYSLEGDAPGFAFNSQKQYISLYVSARVHVLNVEALQGLDTGKSCIRFRRPEQIDITLLDKLLADTARLATTNG